MKVPAIAWVAAGGLGLGLVAVASRKKPRRKKKRKGTSGEPWENEVLADLGVLAQFPEGDDPPVNLSPGERFWLKIDEGKVGSRAKTPEIGSVDKAKQSMPACLAVVDDQRRGSVRYVAIKAIGSSFCDSYIAFDSMPSRPGAEGWLGFRVRVEPPLEVGRAHVDELAAARAFSGKPGGAHVVARPGQRVALDCTGYACGHVTVVLPRGEYETYVRAQQGGEAFLVDLDERAHETVATWLVTKGGQFVLEHHRIATGEVLTCGVVANDPMPLQAKDA